MPKETTSAPPSRATVGGSVGRAVVDHDDIDERERACNSASTAGRLSSSFQAGMKTIVSVSGTLELQLGERCQPLSAHDDQPAELPGERGRCRRHSHDRDGAAIPARASTLGKSTRTRAACTAAQTTVTSVVPRARSKGTERDAFWAVIDAVGSATSSTSRLPGQAASICSASFRQPVNTTTSVAPAGQVGGMVESRRHVG